MKVSGLLHGAYPPQLTIRGLKMFVWVVPKQVTVLLIALSMSAVVILRLYNTMNNLRTRQSIFAKYVAQLILKANELDTPVVVLEWYRTKERQEYLVSIGRSKTMNSKHILGLAVDLCFLEDLQDDGKMNWTAERYRHLGLFWESMDTENVWGGSFGVTEAEKASGKFGWDGLHFQHGR